VPRTEAIVQYLRAFYHGLEVKHLENQFTWVSWEDSSGSSKPRTRRTVSKPALLGLKTQSEIIGVRVRHTDGQSTPERALFPFQVNLLEVLDAVGAVLPKDAYALLLVIDQDMYEDEEDDFCCGRAFGGSRIAVVSTARHNPALDEAQSIDREHSWPASHCAHFVLKASKKLAPSATKKQKTANMAERQRSTGAIGKAVTAYQMDQSDFATTYLLRVCRTASHEVGHCFGLAHCPYYACVMQGTSSVQEDSRQPPYVCPVCEMKLQQAVCQTKSVNIEWLQSRRAKMLNFCREQAGAFTPLGAWYESVLSTDG
jgi:archaemetzincin